MAYQFPLNGGRINASIGGNSTSAGAGYQLVSTGTLMLAGGNNVTLSQNANSITIAGPTLSNSNGVTFGTNGTVVTASHNGLTSQSAQALSASNGSFAFQTAAFSNANGITFGTSAGSIMTASVDTSYAASNHSHGNPTLSLTNISGTTASASNGLTLSLSAAAQSAQTQSNIQGIIASGSTNYTGNISFANSNGVTFGLSNNTMTASVAGAAQSVQTIGGYVSGNTTGQSSSSTMDARSMSLSAQGGISAGYSAGMLQVSAPVVSSLSNTGIVSISRNGSTISIGAPAFSAGMSTLGNTAGTAGTVSNQLVFVGGNNITLSQSTDAGGNTLSIIGGAGGGGGGGAALYDGANSITSGTARVSANGALTASVNGQTINFSVPATSSLSGAGGVAVSTNGSTIIVSNSHTMNYYQNMDRGASSTLAVPFASMMLQRLNQENGLFAGNITANTVLLNMTANMTATSLSSSHTVSVSIGIYSDNASNLTLINSASTSWALGAATGNTSNYNGPRWLSFVSSQWSSAPNFAQGGEYVFGIRFSTSNYAPPLSYFGQNYMLSNQRSGFIGTSMATATTLGQGNYWNGVINTTALPSSIAASQVNRNNASAIFIPHIILNNRYSGTM